MCIFAAQINRIKDHIIKQLVPPININHIP